MKYLPVSGYQCETSIGRFFIMKRNDGKHHIIHDSRQAGSHPYESAQAALRDLMS
ncbi:MAG: hypothetical protein ABFS39_19230 [Pseudomonadota bacterium]